MDEATLPGQMVGGSAVDQTVAPDDQMHAGNEKHYLSVGRSALDCILAGLSVARVEPARIRNVLDMPCGHGRVLRWLIPAFPQAEFTACDLDESGVAFCRSHFGVEGVVSNVDPRKVKLPQQFDLVWVGSLLTHLDRRAWKLFLRFFEDRLSPGGLVFLTTHGRLAHRMAATECYGITGTDNARMRAGFKLWGFGYSDYPNAEGYGISLSRPDWVLRTVPRQTSLRIVGYTEEAWDDHQDVVVLQRPLDPTAPAS